MLKILSKVRILKTVTIDNSDIHQVYYSIPYSLYLRLKYKLSEQSMKRYINRQIRKGYITPELEPIKCDKCKSTQLESFNRYYDDYNLVEYQVRCKDCGRKLGLWSYGSWTL